MSNDFFNHTANVIAEGTLARAVQVNNIAEEIAVGFGKLPSEASLRDGNGNYAVDAGSTNAYEVTLSSSITAYTEGMLVAFRAQTTNTAAPTLNVIPSGESALGPISIVYADGTTPASGDILSDSIVECRYDATNNRFTMVSNNAVATTKAAAAAASAAAAATSESNASTSEGNASTSETNAAASATTANEWAVTAEDTLVPSGNMVDEYSAYHWAQKAQEYATGTLTYKGAWDASTTTYPTSPVQGDFWKVSVGGTTAVDSVVWSVGDSAIYNGTDWDQIDNSDAITTVFGRTGAITANSGDYTAAKITFSATGDIVATDVQAAIAELDSEKSATGHTHTLATGATDITAAVADLNAMAGANGILSFSGNVATVASGKTLNVASTFQIAGVSVTSTAAELNKLDGFTGVVADLNAIAGANGIISFGSNTATIPTGKTLDLNSGSTFKLGGVAVTASAAAINKLGTSTNTVARLEVQQAFTKNQYNAPSSVTSSGASITWDVESKPVATHTATENTTLAAPSNPQAGSWYTFIWTQHASSPKTLGFNAVYKWAGGTGPTVTATAGAVDVLTFYCVDATTFLGFYSLNHS